MKFPKKTWEAVPDPKIVIAVGACAINGGPFEGSPEVAGGVDPILPDTSELTIVII